MVSGVRKCCGIRDRVRNHAAVRYSRHRRPDGLIGTKSLDNARRGAARSYGFTAPDMLGRRANAAICDWRAVSLQLEILQCTLSSRRHSARRGASAHAADNAVIAAKSKK